MSADRGDLDARVVIELPPIQEIAEALETDLQQVVNLSKNRAWLSLKSHLSNRYTSEREKLIKAILRRNAEPVDQRAVDYARGVLDTIEWMFNLPERVQSRSESERRGR